MAQDNLVASTMEKVRQLLGNNIPTGDVLQEIQAMITELSVSSDFSKYARAALGEEIVYELDVPTDEGPALYLISDGVGVASPAHKHDTWAVIVGIEGNEMNQLYEILSSSQKTVQLCSVCVVSYGDTLAMNETDIHGTVSIGPSATLHLHLYGRSLGQLQPFPERVFSVVPVTS